MTAIRRHQVAAVQLAFRAAVHAADPQRHARGILRQPRDLGALQDRRARAARALKGRYVARILDVGVEGGAPFVVSEYLEGSDVTSYLRRRGPIRVREAVKYLLQICEAVAEAHGIGILHRDIKPENLFLSFGEGAPSVKVLDFGVSAVACGVESEGPNAASGAMRTSLLFMAPEQMRSAGGIDERADIYSFGCMVYELITGKLPFTATSPAELLNKHLRTKPTHISVLNKNVHADFADLLHRMLAKEVKERPDSLKEFIRDLKAGRVFQIKPKKPQPKTEAAKEED